MIQTVDNIRYFSQVINTTKTKTKTKEELEELFNPQIGIDAKIKSTKFNVWILRYEVCVSSECIK